MCVCLHLLFIVQCTTQRICVKQVAFTFVCHTELVCWSVVSPLSNTRDRDGVKNLTINIHKHVNIIIFAFYYSFLSGNFLARILCDFRLPALSNPTSNSLCFFLNIIFCRHSGPTNYLCTHVFLNRQNNF